MRMLQSMQARLRSNVLRVGAFPSLVSVLFSLSLATSPVFAGPKDKPFTSTVLYMSKFKGMTFYEFMEAKGGIHQNLNLDLDEPLELIDLKRVKEIARAEFDPKVFRKILNFFKDGERGFDQMFRSLEAEIRGGRVVTMQTITQRIRSIVDKEGLLKSANKVGLAPMVIAPLVNMASGGGTTIVIDDANFFLNYQYRLGPDDEGAEALIEGIMKRKGLTRAEAAKELEADALKSGRNFGLSGDEKLLDFSDTELLRKVESWIENATPKEAEVLWNVVFDMLTNTDSSGMKNLSKEGQSVVNGWLTVYTAELRRHTMVKMHPSSHPWENDLTESLMASVFVKKNGGYMFADKSVSGKRGADGLPTRKTATLVAGKPENFFGIGTAGSGIGVNRQERRGLQTLLTMAMEESHPDEVAEVRRIIGKEKGDIFRGVMEYLNNPENQAAVKKSSAELRKAFTAIMLLVHEPKNSKRFLAYFADVGAALPVTKRKFADIICRSYLRP